VTRRDAWPRAGGSPQAGRAGPISGESGVAGGDEPGFAQFFCL